MKTCVVCKESKGLDSFFNSKQSKDGKSYRCKTCDASARAKTRAKSPGTKEGYRRRMLKASYGITLEDYDRMLAEQEGRCAICGTDNPVGEGNSTTKQSFSFAVDHCHDTGLVRGLLCNPCNRGLGFFKDNIGHLILATRYLSKAQGLAAINSHK